MGVPGGRDKEGLWDGWPEKASADLVGYTHVPPRVEYDIQPAALKILEAGLPKQLALRMLLGR